MAFLLDTNVLSAFSQDRPAPAVIAWLRETPATELYLSVLTIGELRHGIERLPDSKRRGRLRAWLDELAQVRFAGRLLPLDAAVADRWGRLTAEAPRTLPAVDALFAATALAHDLVLATRNTRDFAAVPGLLVHNPWLD